MVEKPKPKATSSARSSLARKFVALGKSHRGLPTGLTYVRMAVALLIAIGTSLLLAEYQFQTVPLYSVGDISELTIQAPQDFTVRDEDATLAKRAEVLSAVPVVFDFDFKVNNRLESELRKSFQEARIRIGEARKELGISPSQKLSSATRQKLVSGIQESLPRFQGDDRATQICLQHEFSQDLENQLVDLLKEGMKQPGVISERDVLLNYQNRGIIIRNTITGEENRDWMGIRDREQALDLLWQNDYILTAVGGNEKKELIRFLNENWLRPNVDFNEEATETLKRKALADVDPVLVQVKRGKTIIRAGDELTESKLAQLAELRKLKRPGRFVGRLLGTFIVVGFFFLAIWQYFVLNQQGNSRQNRAQFLLVISAMVIALIITRVFFLLSDLVAGSFRFPSLQDPAQFYLFAPMAMGAMLVVLLAGVNLSLLFSLVFAVFVGLLSGEMQLFVYTLTGSLTAVYALEQYRERSAIVRAGLIIGLVNMVVALALQFYSTEATFNWTLFGVRSLGGLVSGVVSAMLTALLLPALESLFRVTTDIRLLELSNLNSPMLKRLAVEAPGTYHHSIIVGTLAEAGAEAIGANALLIRVGAYYHDVGKLRHPEYYVENQIYCANKHEQLSPTMSSLILASHVKDGLAIAEEINLSPKVADLIPQHHGTRLMTFFYQKAREAADEKNVEINEDDFRYPGPKPQSKEAAILMLADQVEAAARTLQEPGQAQIRSLIRRLIQSTLQDGQFDECEINMKELSLVAGAFERVLTGMYHHRIEYPGFEFNRPAGERRPENQRIQ